MPVLIWSFNAYYCRFDLYNSLVSSLFFVIYIRIEVKNLATNCYIDFEVPYSPKFLLGIISYFYFEPLQMYVLEVTHQTWSSLWLPWIWFLAPPRSGVGVRDGGEQRSKFGPIWKLVWPAKSDQLNFNKFSRFFKPQWRYDIGPHVLLEQRWRPARLHTPVRSFLSRTYDSVGVDWLYGCRWVARGGEVPWHLHDKVQPCVSFFNPKIHRKI
jgi:hypothetical protein